MVDNATVPVQVAGHTFAVAIHDNYSELHAQHFTDSRWTVCYQGPPKKVEDLSENIKAVLRQTPDIPLMWRKCKTVLKVATRCNDHIWQRLLAHEQPRPPAVNLYLTTLCKAHLPVINNLIQAYRLATYDPVSFEVAPWDVPCWLVERDAQCFNSLLVPARQWDQKPLVFPSLDSNPQVHRLIDSDDLRDKANTAPSPGEFEVLDAFNLIGRGDLSGAVRRITTAVEVMVEARVRQGIEAAEGKPSADKFLEDTRTSFPRRLAKYEKLTGRTLPDFVRTGLARIRSLRHRIVHGGYRLTSGEIGTAQQSTDVGRWIFNWFENDKARTDLREKRLALRTLGLDRTDGIFQSKITPEGVVISGLPVP
jgi:hypothetical protein